MTTLINYLLCRTDINTMKRRSKYLNKYLSLCVCENVSMENKEDAF